MDTKTYELLSIDVWAGEEPGLWDKNNWFKEGDIEIGDEWPDKDIVSLLILLGYLKEEAEGKVYVIDECDGYIEIRRKSDDYPIYDLREKI